MQRKASGQVVQAEERGTNTSARLILFRQSLCKRYYIIDHGKECLLKAALGF
jgi:hypothetical protein